MSLGENIKLYRKKQKLTQVQLADKANISRSYLADVENNRYNPSVDTLKNISIALGVTLNELLSDNNSNSTYNKEEISLTDEEKNILNLYKKLNDKDKAKFEGMLELKISEYEDSKKIISSTCPSIGEEIS